MAKTQDTANRLLIKVKRETLPQVRDKYPFLYLERGRLEIDDSSVKWIDAEGDVIRLPIATINCLLLGPGVSITHEAVKIISSANCGICWVGEDSLLFYANGISPTSDTKNMQKQMKLAVHPTKRLNVAQKMFSKRFADEDITEKTLEQLRGMEGMRVRQLYAEKAEQYNVTWKGRSYTPSKFELSDLTNQILTATNTALYGIVTSCITAMGYSPHIGFIHSGSPLPFTYDIADLYKAELCVDLAFSLTFEMAGIYNKHRVADAFKKRILTMRLLDTIGDDITYVLGG